MEFQQKFKEKGFPTPRYIGCQHLVLDLILKHSMDQILSGKTTSPNISYNFVQEVRNNYANLRNNFQQSDVKIKGKNTKLRNDTQFLYQLENAYQYYQ